MIALPRFSDIKVISLVIKVVTFIDLFSIFIFQKLLKVYKQLILNNLKQKAAQPLQENGQTLKPNESNL